MSFEIDGIVEKIYDTEQKTDTFQAREFVIRTEEQYTQYIKFQMTQDKCAMMNNFKEGDRIKVFFDLRGRQWQDKYFTNLNAWKVEAMGGEKGASEAAGFPEAPSGFSEFTSPSQGSAQELPEMDDLPF
jgi:single-strand DNA-binding protein